MTKKIKATTVCIGLLVFSFSHMVKGEEYAIISKESDLILLDTERVLPTKKIGLFETHIYSIRGDSPDYERITLYIDCPLNRWTVGTWTSYDSHGRPGMETIFGFDDEFENSSFAHKFPGRTEIHPSGLKKVNWVSPEMNSKFWDAPYGLAFRTVCQARFSPSSNQTIHNQHISQRILLDDQHHPERLKGFTLSQIIQAYRSRFLQRSLAPSAPPTP